MTDILLVIMLDLHVSLTRKVNLPDMYSGEHGISHTNLYVIKKTI
jgi:hypothetical protein